MAKKPRLMWLTNSDIEEVSLRRKDVILRTDKSPKFTSNSSLDVPVVPINETTYRLDHRRIESAPVFIPFAAVVIPREG